MDAELIINELLIVDNPEKFKEFIDELFYNWIDSEVEITPKERDYAFLHFRALTKFFNDLIEYRN